jgi:hypothetical protein
MRTGLAIGWGQRVQWSGVGDALMGPMAVVEPFELPERVDQVALVPDQGAVEQFAAADLYPAFHDRVHAGVGFKNSVEPRELRVCMSRGDRVFVYEPVDNLSSVDVRAGGFH